MEISRLGLNAYQSAQRSLADNSNRIVRDGPDVDAIVGLKQSEQQAKIGAKLIEKGLELEDSLLDILA